MIVDEILRCIIVIGLFCILMSVGMIIQYTILMREEYGTWKDSFKAAFKYFFLGDEKIQQ